MKKPTRVIPKIVGRDLNMHDGRPCDSEGRVRWGRGFFGYSSVTITAFVVWFEDGSQSEHAFNVSVHPDDEMSFRWNGVYTTAAK